MYKRYSRLVVEKFIVEVFFNFVNVDMLLSYGVMFMNCYGVIFKGIEVDGDVEWGINFVLMVVVFVNSLGIVEVNILMFM